MMGERWRPYRLVIFIVLGIVFLSLGFTLIKHNVLTDGLDQRSGAERIMGDYYYDKDAASRTESNP